MIHGAFASLPASVVGDVVGPSAVGDVGKLTAVAELEAITRLVSSVAEVAAASQIVTALSVAQSLCSLSFGVSSSASGDLDPDGSTATSSAAVGVAAVVVTGCPLAVPFFVASGWSCWAAYLQ